MSGANIFADMLANAVSKSQPDAPTQGAEIRSLPLHKLVPGRFQPRKHFDAAALADLTENVRRHGILQPLLVRPQGEGYEIVAGERRYRAAQAAELLEVPVHVRHLTDQEAQMSALLENLQRDDLSPFEEIDAKLNIVSATLGVAPAEARRVLTALTNAPEADVIAVVAPLFQSMGRESWESYARNKLRMYGWPEAILQAMREGLSFTVAGVIAAAPEDMQADLLALAAKGASRQELKDEVKRARKPKKRAANTPEQLRAALGNRKLMAKLPPERSEEAELLMQRLLELLSAQ